MQEQQQQGGWTPIEDAKKTANVLVFIARVLASPVEVILRRRFGSKYFSFPTVGALFAVPMWMLFYPREDPKAIWVFWGLFLVMQARARLESVRMVAKGDIVHTRYNGQPRLSSILKRTSELKIKAVIEPLLVFLAGVFLCSVSLPLGSYLMVAAFCLGLNHSIMSSVERARALEMNDALIEQEVLAERFRDIQNDRRR